MRWALLAVVLLALTCLLVRAAGIDLAGDYVDPIGKISAQDEALYAHSAIRMAHQGGWLTPMFMGRYALYKPPLLMWAAGFSARVFGISRLALRLPVALLCAFAAGLIFLWAAEVRSWKAGVCAAALLASSHLWHVLAATCMTDGLLAAFTVAALYCLYADPWLESKGALWGFAASVAAALLTKSVAGALPLAVLALYWLAAPRKQRPAFARVCLAGALAVALAAPWFLYQMAVHGRWFWAEHVQVEILGFGAGAPPQTSREGPLLFYGMRQALLDPVLTALALAAIPGLWVALRKRSAAAILLACWLAVMLGAAGLWQYRNVSYLLPLLPALALLAAAYGPLAYGRRTNAMLALVCAAFLAKCLTPQAPWGISFAHATIRPVARIVSDYCRRGRSNELILAGVDDDLYAATLPLPKLRYCLIGPIPPASPYAMDFRHMGIVMRADQFNDLARWMPVFRRHLAEWGLHSDEPVGTLILAPASEDLAQMVRAHPSSDFLIPTVYRAAVEPAAGTHALLDAGPRHFFLLARDSPPRKQPPEWPCRP